MDAGGKVVSRPAQERMEKAPKGQPRGRGRLSVHRAAEPLQFNRPAVDKKLAPTFARKVEKGEAPVYAIVATHGMGQPMPFGTLDLVLSGLQRAERQRAGVATFPKTTERVVRVGDEVLRRAEVELTEPKSKAKVQVHLYEGYWAPIMEGNVTFRNVVGFVWTAATNGLFALRRGVQRYLFNRMFPFPLAGFGRLAFFALLLLLACLVSVNGVIAYLAATSAADSPTDDVRSQLTWPLLVLSGAILVFAILLAAATRLNRWLWARMPPGFPEERRRPGSHKAAMAILNLFGWLAFVAVLGLLVFAGVYDAYVMAQFLVFPNLPRWWNPLDSWILPAGVIWGAAVVLVFATGRIRRFAIQFFGDVAAYVQTNKLDEFAEIRKRVKEAVAKVARPVYAARHGEKGPFLYDKVILVGHSLGSVITYDVLNQLLNEDDLAESGQGLHVVDRTRMLVTFGSPLDKTAFFFANQYGKVSETRESLAAVVQPLIKDYTKRPHEWLNVSAAPADIFCGALDLYDVPQIDQNEEFKHHKDKAVKNIRDPDASFPIAAHNQYWDNNATWNRIHGAITDF